ncbi:MAG: BirA family biotin operon repressor/biotin-[acetyl-CoA-carboxylase] ligase [Flavobacteriaceae bacterium]
MKLKIIKLNAIDSTNSYLKDLCKNTTVSDCTLVVANVQTQGRGQMGARWQSKQGQSLTFSMLKRFNDLHISDQSSITFGVSIAIKKVLEKLRVPAISVKWPNDIMSYGEKLCGILIENQLEGSYVVSTIIGIGLNVNESQFSELPQATSMRLATGNVFERNEVLELMWEEIQKQLEPLQSGNTLKLKSAYEASLFRRNKVSTFEDPTGFKFNGIILGVAKSGELLVEKEDESVQNFELKQIKLLF